MPSESVEPADPAKSNTATSRKRSPSDAFGDSDSASNKKRTVDNKQRGSQTQSSSKNGLHIIEIDGDLFDAPVGSLLIHACNAKGSWGAGIAKAFRQQYPAAFEIYRKHCQSNKNSKELVGTALLIPPSEANPTGRGSRQQTQSKDRRHFIGCVFTSHGFGKAKAKPDQIIEATKTSMVDILRQAHEWNSSIVNKESDENKSGKTDDAKEAETAEATRIKSVQMCRINSGLFGVPWEQTREVLDNLELDESMDEGAGADPNLRNVQVILHD